MLTYVDQHLKKFLETHELLKIRGLEREIGLPDKTLTYLKKGERGLPKVYLDKVVAKLEEYGYRPLTSE